MYQGTTKSGFQYRVEEDTFTDMELIDALADVQSGRNILQISYVVHKIFDDEQCKTLYEHVRNEKGRVPYEGIMDIIQEIVEAGSDGKNS